MIVRLASEQDANGFIVLAGQVEHWFGPMVDDPGFRAVIDKHIRQATALVAAAPGETDLLGGLLFSAKPPTYHVQWLVVSERARRHGVGRALMTEATRRFPPGPATVEVITFGTDHPGAAASGARLLRAPGIHRSRDRPARPRRWLPPGLPQNHCLTEAPASSYSAAAYYPDLLLAPVS